MTEAERREIINFAAACMTIELIDRTDKTKIEKDQLILLAASHGPAIIER